MPLAQALIKAPQIAVLDVGAFLATSAEPDKVLARLREYCSGMTLFLLVGDDSLVDGIPLRIVFDGPSGTIESEGGEPAGDAAIASTRRRGGLEQMEARS